MKKIINLPASDEEIQNLRAGDVFYLSGTLVTGRDKVYRRIAEEDGELPLDLTGMAIYHAGPIVRKKDLEWELISIGPTSSMRMEKWTPEFIKKTKVKVMIGKGGMGEKTTAACIEHKTIHCIYPGGCAVLGAGQVEKIEGVYWQEFGMAECAWIMKTCRFGPLIVSIDTHGNNIFTENSIYYRQNM